MQSELTQLRDQLHSFQKTMSTLRSQDTTLIEPVVYHLENSRDEHIHLEDQLSKTHEFAKELSLRLSQSVEQTKQYQAAFEHRDFTLRRKEESSKHATDI